MKLKTCNETNVPKQTNLVNWRLFTFLAFFVLVFGFWMFHWWQKPQSHFMWMWWSWLDIYMCICSPKCCCFCLHDQIYFVVRTTSGPNLTLWSSNLLYAFVIFQRFCLLISRNLKYWGLLCVFYVFIPTKKRLNVVKRFCLYHYFPMMMYLIFLICSTWTRTNRWFWR